MSLIACLVLLLHSVTAQLSSSPLPINSYTTNTCLKRSVLVYTSLSSTYVVTDIGTSFPNATPTLCANASTVYETSTRYGANQTITTVLPGTTVTLTEQPLPTSGGVTLSNAGFENGQVLFNTSSSGQVTAQVTSGGPIQPYSGDNYLLITFGDVTASAPAKRQADVPSVYNATQTFNASAGVSYVITAYAATVQNSDSVPMCSLTVCGDEQCSAAFELSGGYTAYSYNYVPRRSSTGSIAIFSVRCTGSAYVALDNIQVIESSSGGATPATRTITQFVTQTLTPTPQTQINTQLVPVTTTETISLTTTISGSQIVVTTAVPTIIWSTVENVQTEISTALVPITTTQTLTVTTSISGSNILITTAIPTVIYSTAIVENTYTQTLERTTTATAVAWTTATVEVPNTRWMNQTATRIDTTTTTVTSTLNITTTQDRNASYVTRTATATTTNLVTETSLAFSELQLPASTLYTTQLTPVLSTTTINQPTIIFETVTGTTTSMITETQLSTLPAVTLITTEGTTLLVTLPANTESVPYTLPQETLTLPQATFTPTPQTIYITMTLEPSTITRVVSVTPPPVTEVQTETLPQATSTIMTTLRETTFRNITFTLPAETMQVTTSLPAETTTRNVTIQVAPITTTQFTNWPTTTTSTTTTTTTTTRATAACATASARGGALGQGGCPQTNGADKYCFCNWDVDGMNAYCTNDDATTTCHSDADCAPDEFCDAYNTPYAGQAGTCSGTAGCVSTYDGRLKNVFGTKNELDLNVTSMETHGQEDKVERLRILNEGLRRASGR